MTSSYPWIDDSDGRGPGSSHFTAETPYVYTVSKNGSTTRWAIWRGTPDEYAADQAVHCGSLDTLGVRAPEPVTRGSTFEAVPPGEGTLACYPPVGERFDLEPIDVHATEPSSDAAADALDRLQSGGARFHPSRAEDPAYWSVYDDDVAAYLDAVEQYGDDEPSYGVTGLNVLLDFGPVEEPGTMLTIELLHARLNPTPIPIVGEAEFAVEGFPEGHPREGHYLASSDGAFSVQLPGLGEQDVRYFDAYNRAVGIDEESD